MAFDLHTFGKDYRRFLQLSSLLAHLPPPLAYRLAGLAGQRISPLRWQKEAYHKGLLAGVATDDWPELWKQRVQNHAVNCINIFLHAQWDTAWFHRHVQVDTAGLQAIMAAGRGCLFLTYHHIFQHTLCALLGLAGFRVDALAAPEESSAIYEQVGTFIHMLHRGTAAQFNGGDYLFGTTPRQTVRMAEASLTANSVLISLHDFSVGHQDFCQLAGRRLYAPSGSVRVAQKRGTPIVAGAVIREGGTYRMVYRQLDAEQPYQTVLQEYFNYLMELIRDNPCFWDGWEWFSWLPLAENEGT